jgi:hypothetical protein
LSRGVFILFGRHLGCLLYPSPLTSAANIKNFKKDRCGKYLAAPTLIGRPISIHLTGAVEKWK